MLSLSLSDSSPIFHALAVSHVGWGITGDQGILMTMFRDTLKFILNSMMITLSMEKVPFRERLQGKLQIGTTSV